MTQLSLRMNWRGIAAALFLTGAAEPALPADTPPTTVRAEQIMQTQRLKLAPQLKREDLAFGAPVYVRIFKEERRVEVWMQGADGAYHFFKRYFVCSYSGTLGPKLREGDRQAPEGFYTVTPTQLNPDSQFHLSLDLGFPNEFDRANGRTGSLLMVHGACVSVGCYAITDRGIEEVYTLVHAALVAGAPSVPVHVFPFRPTDENLSAHADSRWRDFWASLKPAYDQFETTRQPPRIALSGTRYVVLPPSASH